MKTNILYKIQEVYLRNKKACKIIGFLFFVVALAILSFQYYFTTHFPIGDDPAIHIWNVQSLNYSQLFSSTNYPLPLIIFKLVHNLTAVAHPQLFVFLICCHLFLAGLAMFLLARKTGYGWAVGIAAALIFVTSRWTNDGLRMGLFAESFGWAILLFSLYFLAIRNLPLTLLFTIILAFSHPFSFTIFVLVLAGYLLFTILSRGSLKDKKVELWLIFSYLIGFLLAWHFDPALIKKFLQFSLEAGDWGNRSLWEIVSIDDKRRILIPVLALVGIVASFKNFDRPSIKISFLLLLAGLFMSLNYLFGINFLTFRFYPYLEMGLSIFCTIGLYAIISYLKAPKYIEVGIMIILTFFLLWPNHLVNKSYYHWQAYDPSANASIYTEDLTAIEWIKNNTQINATFESPRKEGIWITALTGRTNIIFSDQPQLDNTAQYIYIPSRIKIDSISTLYRLVYDNKVKIYEKK